TLAWGHGSWNREVKGEVTLWDFAAGKSRSFQAHDKGVFSLAFHPKGGTLVTGGYESPVRVWNLESFVNEQVLTGHTGNKVNAVVFSRDGGLLATAGSDRTALLWDAKTWKKSGEPEGPAADWITSLAFSRDGKALAAVTGAEHGPAELRLWDVGSTR